MTTPTPLQLNGAQLKKLRRLHDISQDALAKRSGMDRRKISMLETSDSPLPETLVGALYGLCPHCADSVKTLHTQPQHAQNLANAAQSTLFGTAHAASFPQYAPQSAVMQSGNTNADAGKLFYFERRCADLTAEVQVLKAQNGDLQRRLDEAEDDVHELEKLLSQIQTKTALNDKFDELKRTADNALKKEEMNAELLGLAMTHAPAIVSSLTEGFMRLRGQPSLTPSQMPRQMPQYTKPPFQAQSHQSAPFPKPSMPHNADQSLNDDDDFIRTPTE